MNELGEIIENIDLKNYNTYHISVKAHYGAFPKTTKEFINLLEYAKENSLKYFVIGAGSNIILSDSYFDGMVIILRKLNEIKIDVAKQEIFCCCGAMLPVIATRAINELLKGLEWAVGIPGTIGGALYGNAGAYLDEIANYVVSVKVYHAGEILNLEARDLDFSYRHSFFKSHKDYYILEVTLKLLKGNKSESLKIVENRKERRLLSQPLDYPSAGSVFRNPSKDLPAGKLIEDCGLKGYRIGDMCVANKHANFIISLGASRGKDVRDLIKVVKVKVKDKFKIDLICEQEMIDWE